MQKNLLLESVIGSVLYIPKYLSQRMEAAIGHSSVVGQKVA